MGLFSKTATTDDVYAAVIAIQASCLGAPGAQEEAKRRLETLRGRRGYMTAIAETLAEIGGLLKQGNEEHPDMRAGIEAMVMETIEPIAHQKNDAAARAMIELGRVFFLDGSLEEIIALAGQQAHDPALTRKVLAENMMDLVTVAGGVSAATNMEFGS